MSRQIFFITLTVLVVGILYVMNSSDTPPETHFDQTPNEFIELVEKKKAARIAIEKALKQAEERNLKAQEADPQQQNRPSQ
jgi:hypothetical protein